MNDGFMILAHINPDGDAIGSAAGLLRILRSLGKRSEFFMPENFSPKYLSLTNGLITKGPPDISSYPTIICVDFSSPERASLPEKTKLQDLKNFIINIDHHPDNQIFGNLNLVDPGASAAAQVIFNLAKFAGWPISPPAANCLLAGILMDTGGFKFDNTSPSALRAAASLIELGADYASLVRELFFSKNIGMARVESEIVKDLMKTAFDGKFAWAVIEDSLFTKNGLDPREGEGLIDVIRCIAGTVVVAFLYRNDDGMRFSLRSKDPSFSVGKIARKIGGGGHELAAGGFIKTDSINDAEKILLNEIGDRLNA
jgi:phosphoesterase RecJ-like protein